MRGMSMLGGLWLSAGREAAPGSTKRGAFLRVTALLRYCVKKGGLNTLF